jgi:hypothetical protein
VMWLSLTAEVEGFVFGRRWYTPLTWVGTLLFNGLPVIHVYPWDLMVFGTTAVALTSAKARRHRSPELLRSTYITALFLGVSWLWGIVFRGGDAYMTVFQLHPFVMGLCVAHMIMATHRTAAHLRTLAKVFAFAALYRCGVLFAFWFAVARDLPFELPTLTDHADCSLFVAGLLLFVLNFYRRPSIGRFVWLAAAAIITCTAMALNNRRIAWLQLEVGLVVAYLLLPSTRLKRRVTATMLALSPVVAAYIVVGWGHSTGIFKPVGSISSMFGANQDTSSIMRDIENHNLIKTLKINPLLGAGWGNQYYEEVVAFDISGIFPQYRFLPHNSLLGAIAFTGMLGFAGVWQIVPVACFLAARATQMTRTSISGIAGVASITTMLVAVIHMWGDLGFSHLMVNTVMGVGLGVAGCLPHIVETEINAPVQSRGSKYTTAST